MAASPNNSLCAVGIAYNAQIGGIRMLDGQGKKIHSYLLCHGLQLLCQVRTVFQSSINTDV